MKRLYYWLPVLAERWKCSVDDLVQLGMQGQAQICANIYGATTPHHGISIDESVLRHDLVTTNDPNFTAWRKRTTVPMPDGIYEVMAHVLRTLDMPGCTSAAMATTFRFGRSWEVVHFDDFDDQDIPRITLSHLCMLHEEVVRLDSVFNGEGGQLAADLASVQQPPAAESDRLDVDREMHGKERRSLLRVIGALCHALKIEPKSSEATGKVGMKMEGTHFFVAERTVRKILRQVEDAADDAANTVEIR